MKFIFVFILIFSFIKAEQDVIDNLDISNKLEKIKLQLQWKHQFEFAGFYAAKEKGFYKDIGLDLEFKEYDSNINIVDEVLKGNSDYGLSYSSLIIDYMNEKPIVILANFLKQSPLVLVTQKEIETISDLKDKKIMGLFESNHYHTIEVMLKKFGIEKNNIQSVPRIFTLDDFIKKKIDAFDVYYSNEIYELNKRGISYNIFDPAVYGVKFYDSNLFTSQKELAKNPIRAEKFREASIKGWEYALANKEEIVNIILTKYNSQNKTKEALLFEANQIEQFMLSKVYPIGSIDPEKIQIIVDDYIQSEVLSKENIKNIDALIYKNPFEKLKLTPIEQKYLLEKKELKFCIDPNWMPLEKIERGKHIGISSSYINLISQKIKTPIKLVPTSSWSESLEKIKRKECDFLTLAGKTPTREKYLNFTTPYIKIPIVIVTKIGIPFIDKLESVLDKPLGIVKGYSSDELLQAKYPNNKFIQVESVSEGLKKVASGEIFGLLDNSIVINDEIQKNHINDLSISGKFEDSYNLSIASRNDEKVLIDIMEKTLLSIDKKAKNEIMDKWININYTIQTDYTLVWQIVLFTLIIISIFIYWNIVLKKEIYLKEKIKAELEIKANELKIAKQELEELNNSLEDRIKIEIEKNLKQQIYMMQKNRLIQMGEMIENIAHQWRQPLAQVNSSVVLLDAILNKKHIKDNLIEEKLLEIETLTQYMSKTIDSFKNFFNPNKQKKQFSLYETIEEAILIVKGSLEHNKIKVSLDIDKSFICESYPEELEQVLVILLNNSKDALINKKGENSEIIIKVSSQKDFYKLLISDNGTGIPEEFYEKIFQPYFTTKHKTQGTGLGLYMAKMITEEALNGKLNLIDNKNGTSFEILLPWKN